jgi:hypothetical protein
MRGLAIVLGLAITSVLSVTAYADCKHNYADCNEVVVFLETALDAVVIMNADGVVADAH